MTHRHKLYNEFRFAGLQEAATEDPRAKVTIVANTFCVRCGEEGTLQLTMPAYAAKALARVADPTTGAVTLPQHLLEPMFARG